MNNSLFKIDNSPIDIVSSLNKVTVIPVTLINTRDCFVYDLFIKETVLNRGKGRENILMKEYFFTPECVPDNYRQVVGLPKDADMTNIENMRVGITTYENFYSNEELKNMERHVEETEQKSLGGKLLL